MARGKHPKKIALASDSPGTCAGRHLITLAATVSVMGFPLKLVGLTGGIGSGKSTVGRMIQERGVPVLDADQLARAVVEPGQPAHDEIKAAWPDVFGPDGRLDRKKLGSLVFADSEARKRLEGIMHPRIAAACRKGAQGLADAGHRLAFYEASLLIETGRHGDFDGLVLVTASPEQQLARSSRRDGTTVDNARRRLDAQLPLSAKRSFATHIIDNGGDLAATAAQVDALLAEFQNR